MLEVLRRDPGWCVKALVTTVNETNGRVAMHGTSGSLLCRQAESLGLPLIVIGLPENCDNREYEKRLAKGLRPLRERGVDSIACGDLFLEDIRAWREASFRGMGWNPFFPIWHTPTGTLARDLVDGSWRVVVTCIDTQALPESFLGKCIDAEFLKALPAGVDPCGEHGEFHTFVCDGPGFAEAVDTRPGRRMLAHQRYLTMDLQPA